MEKTSYYLGIDLDNDNAVISYFQLNMKEPEKNGRMSRYAIHQNRMIVILM